MTIYPSHSAYQPKSSEHKRNLKNLETEHHMDLATSDRFDTEDRSEEFVQMGTDSHHEWLLQKHREDRILATKANQVIEQVKSAADEVRAMDQSLKDLDNREGVVLFENQVVDGKVSSGSMRPGVGAYIDENDGWTESSYSPDQNKPYFHIAADDGSQLIQLFEGPMSTSTSDKQADSHYSSDNAQSTYILETPEKRFRAELGHSRATYVDRPRNWYPHREDDTDYPMKRDQLRGRIRTSDIEEFNPSLLSRIRSKIGL